MSEVPGDNSVLNLLARHADLESKHGDGDAGRFLSGWQCANPWESSISELVRQEMARLTVSDYLYFDRDPLIVPRIIQFHELADGTTPTSVLAGAGASSIIFTFCAWLRDQSVDEIFYIPPLYFSIHFALK